MNDSKAPVTSSTEKLLSACLGAFLTSVLVTPMDVIKMRLQTQHVLPNTTHHISQCCKTIHQGLDRCQWIVPLRKESKRIVGSHNRNMTSMHVCALGEGNMLRKHPVVLNGTLDGMYKIVKMEGASSLWRGLTPALAMSVPSNVVYIVGYDYLRDFIRPYTTWDQKDYSPLIAGGFARTAAVSLIAPLELFRTRLQAVSGVQGFQHVLHGVQRMVEKEGLRILWRGLPPTLWRDVPFSAIYWMGYEEIKQTILGMANKQLVPMGDIQASFLAGALSGVIAATLTMPFDVTKTRRQVDVGRDNPMFNDPRMLSILKQIYQQDGIRGLFRGLSPRIAKIAPACAIMISSYELGKTFFSENHQP